MSETRIRNFQKSVNAVNNIELLTERNSMKLSNMMWRMFETKMTPAVTARCWFCVDVRKRSKESIENLLSNKIY